MLGYQLAVLIHILAVIIWIGGSLFLVMVLVPLTRRDLDRPEEGARLLGQIARRFRPVAWTSLILLVITGLFLATDRWQITPEGFFTRTDWFVRVLQIKVGLVAIIIVLSILHDFIFGPRVSNQLEGSDEVRSAESLRRSRRILIWLARTNLLLILVVLALAVTLTRGSPL